MTARSRKSPSLIQVWLALLPLIPGLSSLGVIGVRFWRSLDATAWQMFLVFAFTQQLAALFAPTPLLASVTALLRSLLILGLLGLGARLSEPRRLWPLLIGAAAAAITAVLLSGYGRMGGVLAARLAHPYLTEVSLGILGALSALLSLVLPTKPWIRAAAFLGGVSLLILSGSRGPLLMLAAGLFTWLLVHLLHFTWRRAATGISAALAALVLLAALAASSSGFLSRFLSFDSTGRDLTWLNTLSTVRDFPIGGVGPYLLGRTLADPVQACSLWPTLAEAGYHCPEWLTAVGQPWLIAHNGALHHLGESGVIGTAGLFLLLGTVAASAWRRRDPTALSLLAAVMTGSLLDNTFVVPSPFFAELFWLVAGTQLAANPTFSPAFPARAVDHVPAVWGIGLLLVMGFPVWASFLSAANPGLKLQELSADQMIVPAAPYRVYAHITGPDGDYRLALRTCRTFCQTVAVRSFQIRDGAADIWLEGQVPYEAQKMNLLLLPAIAKPWQIRPLAQRHWTVRVAP